MSQIFGSQLIQSGLREVRYRMIMCTFCGFGIGLAIGGLLYHFLILI